MSETIIKFSFRLHNWEQNQSYTLRPSEAAASREKANHCSKLEHPAATIETRAQAMPQNTTCSQAKGAFQLLQEAAQRTPQDTPKTSNQWPKLTRSRPGKATKRQASCSHLLSKSKASRKTANQIPKSFIKRRRARQGWQIS